MIPVVFLLIVLLLLIYAWTTTIKPKNFPPGPKWYPFFGSSGVVEMMTKKHNSQYKAFLELAHQYSTNLLGLNLCGEKLVVIYGEENLHRAFTTMEFEGRPDSFFIKLRCLGKRMGITFVDGSLWKEHRNFTLKFLKNVGYGRAEMEKEIQSKLLRMIRNISMQKEEPVNPKEIFAEAVMDVLWVSVAGERIKEDRLKFILEALRERSKAFSMAGGWLNQVPWIRFVLPDLSGYSLINKINQQLSYIIEEAIEKHKSKDVEGNDLIYTFLKEMQENKSTYTEEQLKITCLDLLIAGSQTTSNTLEFAVLCALRHQGIQENIYDEIKNVIGDAVPSYADSNRMTYTNAFILEVQRFYTIVPLVGPRRLLHDVVMDGYTIPKETTVLMSVLQLHFDPKLWDQPHEFRPERFIDENGEIKIPPHFYHFGCGRRRCPGDLLAKPFIFITLVGLLQKFRITCKNGELPSADPIIGLLSAPKPYYADFIPRNSTCAFDMKSSDKMKMITIEVHQN